jgi:competence protein ComEC
MAPLEVYLLNVGQADTSVIKTPAGHIIVIDAYRTQKLKHVLHHLRPDGRIAHLIITHPHRDHYLAVDGVLDEFQVQRVTLAPFWHYPGSPGYHAVINRIGTLGIPVRFLSGYERHYPDGGTFPQFGNKPVLELLGPSNSLQEELAEANELTPNHLSIISRLTYGEFSIVFAADAQMENWQHFDQEGMLDDNCDILRAAHHGSKRGSQWERLERLGPSLVVVSSDPEGHHHLPDVVGGIMFWEFDQGARQAVALTHATGTIKIEVPDPQQHDRTIVAFGEGPTDLVFPGQPAPLPPTDWAALVRGRMA